MNETDLKERFRFFAISIYKLVQTFPKESVYFNIEKQILKSSSSAAANYNAACCGKSIADFINKLRIVQEELDETLFWLQYIKDINARLCDDKVNLFDECKQLLAIITASINTVRKNQSKN